MTRFSIPARAPKKSSTNSPLLDKSSAESTFDPGHEVDLVCVSPGFSGKSNGCVGGSTESVATCSLAGKAIDGGVDRGGKMRFIINRRDKEKSKKDKEETAGAIIQDPPQHYQQQYPRGCPVYGYPPGTMPMQPGLTPSSMMPPVMMPMQPGTLPPGMMPYMMPPPYYNYAHYHGSPYNYSSDHDLQGCDYTVDSSISSCSALMCTSEGGLANLFLKTVDSVAESVNRAMGEEVCDPRLRDCGDASPNDVISSPQDHAELLEKIDMLYKLVAEKQASGEAIEDTMDLNPLDDPLEASSESAISQKSRSTTPHKEDDALCEVKFKAEEKHDSVEELTSLFFENPFIDEQVKVTLSLDTSHLNESVEAEADFTDSQNILNEFTEAEAKLKDPRMMKYLPLKSWQAKSEKVTFQKKPTFSSSAKKILKVSTRESEFSSSNSFPGEGGCDVSSPVSVVASLETRSCAYCGLDGGNGKDAKKLMLCSACRLTFYCSSECQLKDWSNGHSVMCQVISQRGPEQ